MTCLWQNVLRSKEYCVACFWREKNAQHGNEVCWASHQRKVRNSNEQRKKTLLDAKAGSKQTQARVKKSMNNLNVNTNTNKTSILLSKYGNLPKVSFVGRFLQPVHILVFLLCPLVFDAFVLLAKNQAGKRHQPFHFVCHLGMFKCACVSHRSCVCVERVNIVCIGVYACVSVALVNQPLNLTRKFVHVKPKYQAFSIFALFWLLFQ